MAAEVRRSNHELDAAEGSEYSVAATAEGKLWVAVLEEAIQELRNASRELCERVDVKDRQIRRLGKEDRFKAIRRAELLVSRVESARRFFNAPPDVSRFRWICETLGLDLEYVRDLARRALRVSDYRARKRIVERGRYRVYASVDRKAVRPGEPA